jgi:NitT/TauT family transport system ATP-binding protein
MLQVSGLGKTYGVGTDAVDAIGDLTFDVAQGEFVCIVGPSGCGKTTMLKCISGLLQPTRGVVTVEGRQVTSPPEEMAMVFQEYGRSLMPWLSVIENVRLPLRKKSLSKKDSLERAEAALAEVSLTAFKDRYPWELSGGMQQRVAIARGIAYQPRVLLMDEPFASVDAQTRADLEDLILTVRDDIDLTVLLVTHDIDEAVYLADRVLVASPAPTSIREVVEINLPKPRDQVETREHADFAHLRTHIFRLINRSQSVA